MESGSRIFLRVVSFRLEVRLDLQKQASKYWHHGLGPPELVGDERHVPNRGAALRWIQAGSYRLPIHLAKPARPISEGTASGSARGRVGRLARWHGLCERPI